MSLYEGQWVSVQDELLDEAKFYSHTECTDVGRAHGLDREVQSQQLATSPVLVGAGGALQKPVLDANPRLPATGT